MHPVRTSMINNGAPKKPRGEKNISPLTASDHNRSGATSLWRKLAQYKLRWQPEHVCTLKRWKEAKLTSRLGPLVLGPQLSDTDNQSETESSSTEGTQKIARWASVNAERERTQLKLRHKLKFHCTEKDTSTNQQLEKGIYCKWN